MKFYKIKETGSDLDIALFKDNYIYLAICKQEVEFNSIIIEKKKIISINLKYFDFFLYKCLASMFKKYYIKPLVSQSESVS